MTSRPVRLALVLAGAVAVAVSLSACTPGSSFAGSASAPISYAHRTTLDLPVTPSAVPAPAAAPSAAATSAAVVAATATPKAAAPKVAAPKVAAPKVVTSPSSAAAPVLSQPGHQCPVDGGAQMTENPACHTVSTQPVPVCPPDGNPQMSDDPALANCPQPGTQLPTEVVGRAIDCPDGSVGYVVDANGGTDCSLPAPRISPAGR